MAAYDTSPAFLKVWVPSVIAAVVVATLAAEMRIFIGLTFDI